MGESVIRRLSFLDRYLTLWIFLAVAVAVFTIHSGAALKLKKKYSGLTKTIEVLKWRKCRYLELDARSARS